jgi:hypothetical protein
MDFENRGFLTLKAEANNITDEFVDKGSGYPQNM